MNSVAPSASAPELARHNGYRAVEALYHALLTGTILTTVLQRGRADAAELVFRLFRRQHLERFLPGLRKLGLERLPHAVACAQYHYLSNALGGVKVEYMPESERKAWVRYLPPRWIYSGTAICGVPSEVSRAILRGWHAHNGVSLGNPRLGFVCTGQTTDGQPGLEGYYYEYDHALTEGERLRFAPGQEGPDFDPAQAPRAEGPQWPAERLRKVERNYTMDYVRNLLPALMEAFGPAQGGALGSQAARLIGMQFYEETARLLGITDCGAQSFGDYLVRLGQAQDDDSAWENAGAEGIVIRQRTWRLMEGLAPQPPQALEAWNGLWEGALSVHNRHLRMSLTRRLDWGDPCIEWAVRKRPAK